MILHLQGGSLRINLVGLIGFLVSLLAAVLFFFYVVIGVSLGFGSGDTELHRDVDHAVRLVALAYFVGVGIGAFTAIGSFVQLGALTTSLPLLWYLEPFAAYGPTGAIAIVLPFLAALILLLSMFVGIEYPEGVVSAPPRSRLRWWHTGEGCRVPSRGLPAHVLLVIVSIAAAVVVILAGFTIYVHTNDVSELDVHVVANYGMYGPVDYIVYLDGTEIHSGTLEDEGSWVAEDRLSVKLPAGSHTLELDAWNDSADLTEGTIDTVTRVRTLPFAKETTYLLVGLAMA